MPVKIYEEDRAEWMSEFDQIATEANLLVRSYYMLPDDWELMENLNSRSAAVTCGIKLTCAFVGRKLHKYQSPRQKLFLAEYFKMDRATAGFHMRSADELICGDKVAISEPRIGFMKLWPLMDEIGIKLNVEGWLQSKEMQIRFIDRQLDMLNKRKEKIQKNIHEETSV
jgi:hypothetical protein|tara:strand:+ start:81 stop:587 length:507 start_codon:yes stop_codon:yes gene_type:complete